MKNIPYIINMSKGTDISIDADEMPKVIEAVQKKGSAILRQGLFNASFYVSVVIDEKRRAKFIDEIRYDEPNNPRRMKGPESLKDIFEGVHLKQKLLGKDEMLSLDSG